MKLLLMLIFPLGTSHIMPEAETITWFRQALALTDFLSLAGPRLAPTSVRLSKLDHLCR